MFLSLLSRQPGNPCRIPRFSLVRQKISKLPVPPPHKNISPGIPQRQVQASRPIDLKWRRPIIPQAMSWVRRRFRRHRGPPLPHPKSFRISIGASGYDGAFKPAPRMANAVLRLPGFWCGPQDFAPRNYVFLNPEPRSPPYNPALNGRRFARRRIIWCASLSRESNAHHARPRLAAIPIPSSSKGLVRRTRWLRRTSPSFSENR